jgi:hypothetical protein
MSPRARGFALAVATIGIEYIEHFANVCSIHQFR